jgi:hypothetical protein
VGHFSRFSRRQKLGQNSLAQAEFEKEYQQSGDEMALRQSILLSKRMLSQTKQASQ